MPGAQGFCRIPPFTVSRLLFFQFILLLNNFILGVKRQALHLSSEKSPAPAKPQRSTVNK